MLDRGFGPCLGVSELRNNLSSLRYSKMRLTHPRWWRITQVKGTEKAGFTGVVIPSPTLQLHRKEVAHASHSEIDGC